jgi:phosphohistidine phosphatase
MDVLIIRHADAGAADPKKYPDDRLRPLSAKGQSDMLRVALGMCRLGFEFDAIFDSGYARARQTSVCICEAFKIDPSKIRTLETLAADAHPADTAAELRKLRGLKSVGLVGHEPHLSRFIGYLLAGEAPVQIDLKKAGVCRLEVKRWVIGGATLRALLPPKLLKKIGK